MFSRDAPRQPEKRFRFLVGQCQPIFPTTTIFLSPVSSPIVESMHAERVVSLCLSLVTRLVTYVDLYRYSAQRIVQGTNEKEIALSTSVREKSSSHDRRTSENSILSGLAKSRLAQLDLRAVLCTYTPLSFPSSQLHPIRTCCSYCKWYTMETRTARIRSLPAPRVYFCNFVFCIASFSAIRRLTRPIIPEDRFPFVDTTVQPSDTFNGGNVRSTHVPCNTGKVLRASDS